MVIGMGRDRNPLPKVDCLVILPALPIERESEALFGQVEGVDPCPDRTNHFLWKKDSQLLASPEQHRSLEQRGKTPDVIDMTMSDQYGVNALDQVSPITQQVNARLPGLDEEMLPTNQEQHAREVPVSRGNAGTCS